MFASSLFLFLLLLLTIQVNFEYHVCGRVTEKCMDVKFSLDYYFEPFTCSMYLMLLVESRICEWPLGVTAAVYRHTDLYRFFTTTIKRAGMSIHLGKRGARRDLRSAFFVFLQQGKGSPRSVVTDVCKGEDVISTDILQGLMCILRCNCSGIILPKIR